MEEKQLITIRGLAFHPHRNKAIQLPKSTQTDLTEVGKQTVCFLCKRTDHTTFQCLCNSLLSLDRVRQATQTACNCHEPGTVAHSHLHPWLYETLSQKPATTLSFPFIIKLPAQPVSRSTTDSAAGYPSSTKHAITCYFRST